MDSDRGFNYILVNADVGTVLFKALWVQVQPITNTDFNCNQTVDSP